MTSNYNFCLRFIIFPVKKNIFYAANIFFRHHMVKNSETLLVY